MLLLFPFWLLGQEYATIRISGDLDVCRLSDHAYVHISRSEVKGFGLVSSNGLILLNEGQAFLFDTPMSDSTTRKLVDWIQHSLKARLTGFVPNHWHADCMGGLSYLRSIGVKSYANTRTIEIARQNHLPVPGQAFEDSLELKLGDERIGLYFLGAAHSMDNIVSWIPSEKILFAGCMVKSMDSVNLGNTADGDIPAYAGTIRKLAAKFPDARIVIPGHGAWGGKELIDHTLKLALQAGK